MCVCVCIWFLFVKYVYSQQPCVCRSSLLYILYTSCILYIPFIPNIPLEVVNCICSPNVGQIKME